MAGIIVFIVLVILAVKLPSDIKEEDQYTTDEMMNSALLFDD